MISKYQRVFAGTKLSNPQVNNHTLFTISPSTTMFTRAYRYARTIMLGIKKLLSTDTPRTYDNAYESTYIRATCVEKEKGKNKESDGSWISVVGAWKDRAYTVRFHLLSLSWQELLLVHTSESLNIS